MLSPGSTVAVVAPGHPFRPERLQTGVAVLRSWDLQVVEMPHLHARYRYTAGTRSERRSDLRAALFGEGIDAVWFARGGSGTVHLMHDLPWSTLDRRPVVGFSDATTLLSSMWNHRAGCPIHGPVLHTLGSTGSSDSDAAVHDLLFGRTHARMWWGEHVTGPRREVTGPLVGGNLCVLASLCGTPLQLDARGCVVLIEEVGEVAYKLDRLLTQLRLSGALDGVVGVAVGDLLGARIPESAAWTALDVVGECLHGLGIPVVAGFPVGHGARNHPFRVGAPAILRPDGMVLLEAP